jgi:hypothetical protein
MSQQQQNGEPVMRRYVMSHSIFNSPSRPWTGIACVSHDNPSQFAQTVALARAHVSRLFAHLLSASDPHIFSSVQVSVEMFRPGHASIVRSCCRPRLASELALAYPGRKTVRLKIGQPTASPCRILSTRAQFFLSLDDGLPEYSCASIINIPSPVSYHFSSCVTLFRQFMMLIRPSQEASNHRRRCLRQD